MQIDVLLFPHPWDILHTCCGSCRPLWGTLMERQRQYLHSLVRGRALDSFREPPPLQSAGKQPQGGTKAN